MTFSVASSTAVATAGGYITAYKVTNCAQASLPVVGFSDKALPQNKCTKLDMFLSFEGGQNSHCPKGQTPEVVAYRSDNCTGSFVSAGPLASDTTPSACQDIVAGDLGSGVNVGGHSAKFLCVA